MEYIATGIMSGTSLDGMDIACCSFKQESGNWSYRILQAATIAYSENWKQKLRKADRLSVSGLMDLHYAYGKYIGETVRTFLKKHNIQHCGLIASHGHTILHQPDKGYSFQLGSGAAIAAETSCTVVCDFRSLDIALGGQGAPLVPAGDKLLFGDYALCLNLGGFANISFDNQKGDRIAFDICPLNYVLNHMVKTRRPSLDYDPEGSLGRSGKTNSTLLKQLNALPYYAQSGPKSLGAEWVDEYIRPLIHAADLPLNDALRSFYAHVVEQIHNSIPHTFGERLLVTGGGAHNTFLMELLTEKFKGSPALIIPDKATIDFKEALVFAFLGLLRMHGHTNCLATVSGCKYDHTGGAVYIGEGASNSFAY